MSEKDRERRESGGLHGSAPAEPTFAVSEIRDMVRTIKQGGSLSSSMEDKAAMRMHLAVVRWVNMLGAGDVEAEYELVKGAMSGI